ERAGGAHLSSHLGRGDRHQRLCEPVRQTSPSGPSSRGDLRAMGVHVGRPVAGPRRDALRVSALSAAVMDEAQRRRSMRLRPTRLALVVLLATAGCTRGPPRAGTEAAPAAPRGGAGAVAGGIARSVDPPPGTPDAG